MLITNVDISDRLINGQLGYIYGFTISQDTALKTYIKFGDVRAELKVIQSEKLARLKNVVPIIWHCLSSKHAPSKKLSSLLCSHGFALHSRCKVLH